MRLIGFNFKKINIERSSDSFENLKIKTNIDVSEIEKDSLDFFKGKEELVKIKFKYVIDYEPGLAKIEFEGVILIALEPKIAKEAIDQWKDKKILDTIKIPLFNIIIRKANIKALQFEDELNLPLHVPFPSLRPSEEKDNSK